MKISVTRSVLDSNDQQAIANQRRLDELRLTAVNVLASPGAGKTSCITKLLQGIPRSFRVGVIEGDVASSIDTDKILSLGFPATQINTHGGCHLDAGMIRDALTMLALTGPGFVFVENIGNLICPAEFHLGEHLRVVIASVPEGDDKPIKYPGIFRSADAIILNKTDLLGLVEFERARFDEGVRAVNQTAPIFPVSCRKDDGVTAVVDWLLAHLHSES